MSHLLVNGLTTSSLLSHVCFRLLHRLRFDAFAPGTMGHSGEMRAWNLPFVFII
jgi:hypothetical protein